MSLLLSKSRSKSRTKWDLFKMFKNKFQFKKRRTVWDSLFIIFHYLFLSSFNNHVQKRWKRLVPVKNAQQVLINFFPSFWLLKACFANTKRKHWRRVLLKMVKMISICGWRFLCVLVSLGEMFIKRAQIQLAWHLEFRLFPAKQLLDALIERILL